MRTNHRTLKIIELIFSEVNFLTFTYYLYHKVVSFGILVFNFYFFIFAFTFLKNIGHLS